VEEPHGADGFTGGNGDAGTFDGDELFPIPAEVVSDAGSALPRSARRKEQQSQLAFDYKSKKTWRSTRRGRSGCAPGGHRH
jgi:hypothetical protein